MGIAILFQKYLEQPTIWLLAVVGLHLLSMLYFEKVHGLIFKNSKQSAGMAMILSVLGVGIGQAYNRQLLKGIVYFTIFSVSIFILKPKLVVGSVDMTAALIVIGLYILIIIDAVRGTAIAQQRSIVQSNKKVLLSKAKLLMHYLDRNLEFAIDTNILMHEPDLLVYLLEKEQIDLYMSMTVFNELDGLKNNSDAATRYKGQKAFDIIEEYQRQEKMHILKTPETDKVRKYGLGGSPDEKIIGTYLYGLENGHENLIFLSNDKGARILARNANMPVVDF